MFSDVFVSFVTAKFADQTKVENVDAQIFYITQMVRKDFTIYQKAASLSRITRLVSLVNKRKQLSQSPEEQNFWTFRLAVTLQDAALVKNCMQNY